MTEIVNNSTLSENAIEIINKRYATSDSEGWENLSIRVGYEVGRIEYEQIFKDLFSEMIYNLEFIPGGRTLRNAGKLRGSMLNCFVLPLYDSIEEIGEWIKNSLITWSEGGGLGTNISTLRPENVIIKGKGGESTGPISFLRAENQCAKCIESGGQRRAAGMALMEVHHPDILKFIDAKMIDGEFDCFNISVGIYDEFLDAVEKQELWDLKFNQQKYNSVSAKLIWDKIIENMVNHAEPGLVNMKNLRNNNSYYFDPIISVNPCSEVALGAYGVCCLGSITLTKFILNKNTNWKRMEEVIRLSVRFLDDVLDVNKYMIEAYKQNAQNGRRIGIGVMGLGEYLFAKKIRYGSAKSIYEIERLMRFIRDISYDESIKLSSEKGSFPKFDSYNYSKAHFIRTLTAQQRIDIKKHGIRNVTLMAMAPTGTISMIPEVTSGIEPLILKAYERKDRISDRIYVHPLYEKILLEEGTTPEWFVDTTDLKPTDHLDVQVAVQKYTDGAVSKTINMPKGTTSDQLSELLLNYIYDLKGVTVYVDGSKEGQPLNTITEEQAIEFIKQKKTKSTIDEKLIQCNRGTCEL